jgi:hypothetical protein
MRYTRRLAKIQQPAGSAFGRHAAPVNPISVSEQRRVPLP